MPIWVDENTIVGEMSDEEFLKQVNKTMTARVEQEKTQKEKYGNDGLVVVYEEHKIYNSIPYNLRVLRYFAVTRLDNGTFKLREDDLFRGKKGLNKRGKHIVVEGKQPPADLQELLGLSELLWRDTLHSGMEDWSLIQQWEWAEAQANRDCERIPGLENEFNERVSELRKKLRKFIENSKVENIVLNRLKGENDGD